MLNHQKCTSCALFPQHGIARLHQLKLLQETNAVNKVAFFEPLLGDLGELDLTGIKWAFVGGESGPGARQMEKEWVLNIKHQCEQQGCTFIFKQWGGPQREQRGCKLVGKRYDDIPSNGNLSEHASQTGTC